MAERYFASPSAVHWRQWGDEMVVYDRDRASTHLLSVGAAEALKALLRANTSITIDELARRLLAQVAVDSSEVALSDGERTSLSKIVAELVQLGLAESGSP